MNSISMKLFPKIVFASVLLCSVGSYAQEDADEKNIAASEKLAREAQLFELDWKLKQLEMMVDERNQKYQVYLETLLAKQRRGNKLSAELPTEMRFASKQVRDTLVGECLKELLRAKLDLASHEIMVQELNDQLAQTKETTRPRQRMEQEKHKLQIQAAEMKLDLARNELEMTQKLHSKGTMTSRELQRSRYAVDVAELELANARVDLEMSSRVDTSDIAQRLVDARINIPPLKARVKAAEAYLQKMADAGDTLREIEELQSMNKLEQENAQTLLRAIWEVNDEVSEVKALKKLTEARMKELQKEK